MNCDDGRHWKKLLLLKLQDLPFLHVASVSALIKHFEENDFEPVDDMLPDEREVVQVAHRGSFRDFTQALLDQVVHTHTQTHTVCVYRISLKASFCISAELPKVIAERLLQLCSRCPG